MLISFKRRRSTAWAKNTKKPTPKLFAQNIDRGSGDDIAFIYYTSGHNRAAQGRQDVPRALISTAQGFIVRYPIEPEGVT